MNGLESAIEQALREPELVIQSTSDAAVQLIYRHQSDTLVGEKWLGVVIKYGQPDAFIVTAYLTDKAKKGRRLWPIEQPRG